MLKEYLIFTKLIFFKLCYLIYFFFIFTLNSFSRNHYLLTVNMQMNTGG